MSKKEKIVLAVVLILAFYLRIWGINYGLPNFFIGDEQSIVGGALKMGELKILIPALYPEEFRSLYYPPFISYLYLIFLTPFILIKYLFGGFLDFAEFRQELSLNYGFVWFWARFFTALIGSATIYLVYLIGKKFFNKKTAFFASLFFSLSFFHLQLSHFARHWAPIVFFFCLAVLISCFIYKSFCKKYYFLAGLVSGLAFGISYIGALSLLFILTIHFLKPNVSLKEKIINKNLWLMVLIFFVFASLAVALHPQEFLRITVGEDTGMTASKSFAEYLNSFYYYFKALLFLEPILLLFSLAGFIVLYFKDKKIFFIFSFFIFSYISILYLFFHHEPRYIIFVLPLLCLTAGFALFFVFNKAKFSALLFLIPAIFLYPFLIGLKYDFLLNQKDTRVIAKEWIEENLDSEAKIISALRDIKLTPVKEAIEEQVSIDQESLRSLEKILLETKDDKYPQPSFYVFHSHFVSRTKLSDLKRYAEENNYQYFVVSYWDSAQIEAREKEIINSAELEKTFSGNGEGITYDLNANLDLPINYLFSLDRLGPIVEIYKLPLR
ncbi:MAG: glycosyl transferase family protein [Parcubacteria group bacterium Athens0714_12]|nr:MAG: glycosyl transferase family protein [Parcubacteria group bacterium Athens0714_12]